MGSTRFEVVVGVCLLVAVWFTPAVARGQDTEPPAKAEPAGAAEKPAAEKMAGIRAEEPSPTPNPKTASEILDAVQELREKYRELAKKAEKDKSATGINGARFRLMRWGVTAGVAAAIYTPGAGGNTLDGIAGGAMPFVGFFPGYWGQNAPKNLYCALEWSTTEAYAVASAEREEAVEAAVSERAAPTETPAPAPATEAKTEAVAKQIDAAEDAARDALKAEGARDAPETPEPGDPGSKKPAATAAANDALDSAKKALKAAQEEYQALLKREEARRAAKADQEYASDKLKRLEALRGELQSTLKEEGVDAEALVALAEQDPLACAEKVSESDLLSKQNDKERLARLACKLAEVHQSLVTARKNKDRFKGSSTDCAGRKFGFYVGYPGMFSANTRIESRTPVNREERDVTPLVSSGFVAAPNALVAFTFGPWFGNGEVAQGREEFIWGFAAGLGLTGDVLTALAD